MNVIIDKKNSITKDSICAIGSFDGIHRGHQEIVKYLKKLAGTEKNTGVITFTPLPFFVLKKAPIFYLTPREEKETIFKELGIDFMYYFTFTKKFAALDPQQFVKKIATRIAPSIVVVGENFHFGRDRKGTAKILQALAKNYFSVEICARIEDDGTISSTRIRELLLLGHMKAANRLLGREYSVSGQVIRGKGKGQQLGFPTINIKVPKEKLIPLEGVYKAKVLCGTEEFLGAMFCRHDLIEVHIIDFVGDFYRRHVTVKFLERIRGIAQFANDETLKSAIARDIEQIIHHPKSDPFA
ncbi:MAG: riboflavin biosynthesis protein RibF [candidate division WOR-3 bacterium]|nr:MAG: riboflavin biosynthesis protein RibF [candidate division WOR-3 bacterium]